ncbi:MAG: GNAT family N-acetyltransferase [Paracoccus sp. (in: a-proteobacteria)]|nr:GNAT family N-acetyltransferase [Paracoccus sp. (in: a-proteobacteria)]
MDLISLTGRLTAHDDSEARLARALLPGHIAASRAEPGCLRFDVTEDAADPRAWHLRELFVDADAFEAHGARARQSEWGAKSAGLGRDFKRETISPALRPEISAYHGAIRDLLTRAFEGEGEAHLVDALRRAGDLAISFVAEADGLILGHIALSPLAADFPAFALAPVAVEPKLQGRGLGSDLIRAAIDAVAPAAVVVLGDPSYYARFGFHPVPGWDAPFAGPYLQARGTDLPARTRLSYAPAFAPLN